MKSCHGRPGSLHSPAQGSGVPNRLCELRGRSSWVDFLEEEACPEHSGVDNLGHRGDSVKKGPQQKVWHIAGT